jgi:tape measure domain-containing protein
MDTNLKVSINLDDNISQPIKKIESNFGKLSRSLSSSSQKIDRAFGSTFDGFNNLVKTTVIGTAGMATAFAGFGIKTSTELQSLAVSFETLTGSAEAGQKVFSDLKKMGAATPFEIGDLARATQTMLAFGISVEDSQKYLQMFGDVSMGNKEKLSGLTLAFSQVASTGRLMGQDLLQMINQGFNPLVIISEKTGRSMVDLKKDMEDGKITVEMVADAFQTATSEGGLFHKGMERGSQTLSGRFSTLKDNIGIVASSIVGLKEDGTVLEGSLLDLTEKGVNGLIEALESLDVDKIAKDIGNGIKQVTRAGQDLSRFYREHKRFIDPVIIGVATLTAGLYALHTAMKVIAGVKTIFLALTSPIGLVVVAISAMVAIGWVVWKNWDTISKYLVQAFNWVRDNAQKAITAIGQFFIKTWNGIRNFFVSTWNGLVNIVNNAINTMIRFIQNIPYMVGFSIGLVLGLFIRFGIEVVNVIASIPQRLQNTAENIADIFRRAIQFSHHIIVGGITWIVDRIRETPSRIVSIITGIPDAFRWAIIHSHGIILGGINWIIDRIREVPSRASSIIGGIADTFRWAIIHSHGVIMGGLNWIIDRFQELPSRVMGVLGGMFNVGKGAMAGFWNGLLSGLGRFGDAIRAGLRAAGVPGLASGTNFTLGGQYLVGETGPEVVTLPRGAKVTRASETRDAMQGQTINLTINNPTVRNDNDINMLVEQITKALDSNQRLRRLGV